MRIELATIQDVPKLQELQHKVPAPYEFYLREGFRPYKDEIVGPGLTWVYMEKIIREHL